MIGDIDLSMKVVRPKIFLSKPDKAIIGKISEAYDITHQIKLANISELRFKMPYTLEDNHIMKPNQNALLIRERYLLKLQIGGMTEWYIIIKVKDNQDDSKDWKEITAFSLGYQLKDKLIRDYKVVARNAQSVLTDILSYSDWGIDYVDSTFLNMYRSFQITTKSVLDIVFEVAIAFNAITFFDTEQKKISLRRPDQVGTNRGLIFSYGHYLRSLGDEINTDEMVTRLRVRGRNGLLMQNVNPTGQEYLEDYSYFMYPYAEDVNGIATTHSNYMSDSICHSLIKYNNLLNSRQNDFSTYLASLTTKQNDYTAKNNSLTTMKQQMAAIIDIKDLQQSDERFNLYNFTSNGTAQSAKMILISNILKATVWQASKQYAVNDVVIPTHNNGAVFICISSGISGAAEPTWSTGGGTNTTDNTVTWRVYNDGNNYATFGYVSNATNLTVTVNGLNSIVTAGSWVLLQKIQNANSITIAISGTSTGATVNTQINMISIAEMTGSTDAQLIEKYCIGNKQAQIDAQTIVVNNALAAVNAQQQQLTDLFNTLSPSNPANFSASQLMELNQFAIEKEFLDRNITTAQELYDMAKQEFKKMQVPQTIIEIDSVNFLECIEEQGNWDKITLGDIVRIKHYKLNTDTLAKIIQVDYNYENGTIKLTIANDKNLLTDANKLIAYLYNSVHTSTLVNTNMYKWDGTIDTIHDANSIIDKLYDRIKQEINMSVNNTVTIDRHGITIYDKDDPKKFLRATNGILGITDDGGNTYKSAITYFGIVGERIYGKIITGERVIVSDPKGILQILGSKGVISDSTGVEVMWFGLYDTLNNKYGIKLENAKNQVIIDKDDGIKITAKNGSSWDNKFYVDTSGWLWAEDLTAKRLKIMNNTGVVMMDSNTQYMNIGKFDNIITGDRITSIEKLQVKVEVDRIDSEYSKLLAQANAYATTSRDATTRISTVNFTNAYNALKTYINPFFTNMDLTEAVVRTDFIAKFKAYYDEAINIINAVNDSLKYSSVQLGALYNNVVIDAVNGVVATRTDGLVRTTMNATDGIKIERYVGATWVKKFYADTNGALWAEDFNVKRINVVNNLGDVMINTDTSFMNIGKFATIITDGKLTPIEKLQVKAEWERIKTEYQKLLSQATTYASTTRDASSRINTTAFTNAYNALNNYITPLLTDMTITEVVDRTVFTNNFQNYYNEAVNIINAISDSIKYSSLQLGQLYNNVLIDAVNGVTVTRSDSLVRAVMNATDGFSMQKFEGGIWVTKFNVDSTGRFQITEIDARKIKLVGNAGELLLDADSKLIDFNKFNMIIGTLSAANIDTNIITASEGNIANLAVNHLKTLGKTGVVGDYLNYIDVFDNMAAWRTSKILSAAAATNANGQTLYWKDANRGGLTTTVTSYPAQTFTLETPREKLKMSFSGNGTAAYPYMEWGDGDGLWTGTSVSGLPVGSSRGYVVKNTTNFQMFYYKSGASGDVRLISMQDDQFIIQATNTNINFNNMVDFNVNLANTITLGQKGGAKIEVKADGTIRITAQSGSYIDIGTDIKLSSIGNINLN